jgi:hypothetical protein
LIQRKCEPKIINIHFLYTLNIMNINKLTLISLTFFLTIGTNQLKAQTLEEDFNNLWSTMIPDNWTQWNLDGKTPAQDMDVFNFNQRAWVSFSFDSKNSFLISTSKYQTAGQSDDWLVTPAVVPVTGDILSWDAAVLNGNLQENYEIRISTTDSLPGSFDILLNSITETSTAFKKHLIDLNSFAGKRIYIAFRNISNNKFILAIDNVTISQLPKVNAGITNISPASGTASSFYKIGSNAKLTVDVTNFGIDTIKSIKIKYSDGTLLKDTVVYTDLPYNSVGRFGLPIYSVTELNPKHIQIFLELENDEKALDDSIQTSLSGTSFWPKHRVTIEEGTGTWCGWCPRGTVYMDSIHKVMPDDVVLIAVHNNDVMSDGNYDSEMSKYFSAFPMTVIERKKRNDPFFLFNDIKTVLPDCGIAEINILKIETNSLENQIAVYVSIRSAINSFKKDDWRLALAITEDGIHVDDPDYDQYNFYSQYELDTLIGANFNWNLEANPVPAEKMTYNFVARHLSNFSENQGSLPDTLRADSTYYYTFKTNIPESIIKKYMCSANVLMSNQTSGQIVNAVSKRFSPVSIQNLLKFQQINILPNPASNSCRTHLINADIQSVTIIDALGHTFNVPYTYDDNTLIFDIEKLVNGIYTVIVQTKDQIFESKFLKE